MWWPQPIAELHREGIRILTPLVDGSPGAELVLRSDGDVVNHVTGRFFWTPMHSDAMRQPSAASSHGCAGVGRSPGRSPPRSSPRRAPRSRCFTMGSPPSSRSRRFFSSCCYESSGGGVERGNPATNHCCRRQPDRFHIMGRSPRRAHRRAEARPSARSLNAITGSSGLHISSGDPLKPRAPGLPARAP